MISLIKLNISLPKNGFLHKVQILQLKSKKRLLVDYFKFFIETKDNKIKAIKVYTDSLNPRFSDENFNTFIGNDYNPENNDKIVELIRLL